MMGFASAVDGWASLMVTVTWQLAALALIGWLCECAFRLRQGRVRYTLWWCVLLAPLVVTPGRMALQRQQAMISVPAPAGAVEVARWQPAPRPMPEPRSTTTPSPALPAGRFAPLRPALRPVDLLGLAWLAGCAALALRLAVGHRHVRRLIAATLPAETETGREMLSELAAQAGVRREVALRVSEAIGSPVLYGWRRPTIVVPKGWLESLAGEELRAMLAHEMAHVKRRDFLANGIQRLIEIPLFFHPSVWLAGRRIALAREELCDSWALSLGTDAVSYARSLAAVAERTQAAFAQVYLGIAESRFILLRRVEAIMTMGRVRRISRPLVITVIAVGLVSAAGLAAVEVTGEPDRESARHADASAVLPAESAAAAPATRTVIRGLLKAPDGRPALGVTVHIEGAFDSRRPETYPSETVTDNDGRFELVLNGPGKRTVWVFDERFYAILARDLESRTGGEMTLPPVTLEKSAQISGRVLSVAGGAPISGASVVCSPILKSGRIRGFVHAEAKTGPDGRFVVAAPPGNAHLSAKLDGYMWSHVVEKAMLSRGHPGVRIRANPDKPSSRSLDVRPGDSIIGVDLFVQPAAIVRGVVLGPDGKRWQHGGYVHATAEVERVASELFIYEVGAIGADGAFQVDNLPSGVPMALVAMEDGDALGAAALVTPSAPTRGVTLQLRPLAVVKGKVLMPDGSPAVGADLTVEGIWRQVFKGHPPTYGPEIHASPRANGTFEILAGVVGLPTRVRAEYPASLAGGPYPEYYGSSDTYTVAPGQTEVDLGHIVLRKPGRQGEDARSASASEQPATTSATVPSGTTRDSEGIVYDVVNLKHLDAVYIAWLFGKADLPTGSFWYTYDRATNQALGGGTTSDGKGGSLASLLPEGIYQLKPLQANSQQLVVEGRPNAIAKLRGIIALIDHKPKQVILEVAYFPGLPVGADESQVRAVLADERGARTVPLAPDSQPPAGVDVNHFRVLTMNLMPGANTLPPRDGLRQALFVATPRINGDGTITLVVEVTALRGVVPSPGEGKVKTTTNVSTTTVNVRDGEQFSYPVSLGGALATLVIRPRILNEQGEGAR